MADRPSTATRGGTAPYKPIEEKYFGSGGVANPAVIASHVTEDVEIRVANRDTALPKMIVKSASSPKLRRPVTATLLVSSTGSWAKPSETLAAPPRAVNVQPTTRWESSLPASSSSAMLIGSGRVPQPKKRLGTRMSLAMTTGGLPQLSLLPPKPPSQPQPQSPLPPSAEESLTRTAVVPCLALPLSARSSADTKPRTLELVQQQSSRTPPVLPTSRNTELATQLPSMVRPHTENPQRTSSSASLGEANTPVLSQFGRPRDGDPQLEIVLSRTSAQLQRALISSTSRLPPTSAPLITEATTDDTISGILSGYDASTTLRKLEESQGARLRPITQASEEQDSDIDQQSSLACTKTQHQDLLKKDIVTLSDLLRPFAQFQQLHAKSKRELTTDDPAKVRKYLLASAAAHKSFASQVAENAMLLLEVLTGRKNLPRAKQSPTADAELPVDPNAETGEASELVFDIDKERKELLALGKAALGVSSHGSASPASPAADPMLAHVNTAFEALQRLTPDLFASMSYNGDRQPNSSQGQALVEAWLTEMSTRRIAEQAAAEGLGNMNSSQELLNSGSTSSTSTSASDSSASPLSSFALSSISTHGLTSGGTVMLAPADQIGIGRRALTESGLTPAQVDAVARGLFVFTIGVASAIKRLIQSTPRAPALFRAIWQTYARLIACSDSSFFAWLSKCLVAESQRRVNARAAEYAAALKSLRLSVAERAQRCASEHAALIAASNALRKNRIRVAQARKALLQDRDGYEALVDRNGSLRAEVSELRAAASARILAAAELRTLLNTLATQYQRSRNALKQLQETHAAERARYNEAVEAHAVASQEQAQAIEQSEQLESEVQMLEREASLQTDEVRRARQTLEKELGTQRALAEQLVQAELAVLRLIDSVRQSLVSPDMSEADRRILESRIAKVKLDHATYASYPIPLELISHSDEQEKEDAEFLRQVLEDEKDENSSEARRVVEVSSEPGSNAVDEEDRHQNPLVAAFSSEFKRRALRMRAARVKARRQEVEDRVVANIAELQTLDDKAETLTTQLQILETQHSEALQELYAEEDKLDRWTKEVEALTAQYHAWAERLRAGEEQLQQNELTQLANVEKRKAEAEAVVEPLRARLKELEEASKDLEQQRTRVHAELQEALVRRMQLEARHEQELRLSEELTLRGAQEMEQLQRRLAAALRSSVQARKQKYEILKEYKRVREKLLDADESIQALTTQVEDSIVERETRKTQAELTREGLEAVRKKLRDVEEQVLREEARAQAAAESYAKRTQELHELLTSLSRQKAQEERLFQEAKFNFIEADRKLGDLQHAYELQVRTHATLLAQSTSDRDMEKARYQDFRTRADAEAEIIHRTRAAAKKRHAAAVQLNQELVGRNKQLLAETSAMRAELSALNADHDELQRQVDNAEDLLNREKSELNARLENERGMLREYSELLALMVRHEHLQAQLRNVHAEIQQQNSALETARWRVAGLGVRRGIQVSIETESIGVQVGTPFSALKSAPATPSKPVDGPLQVQGRRVVAKPDQAPIDELTVTAPSGTASGVGKIGSPASKVAQDARSRAISSKAHLIQERVASNSVRSISKVLGVGGLRGKTADGGKSPRPEEESSQPSQADKARRATAAISEALQQARERKMKETADREARQKRLQEQQQKAQQAPEVASHQAEAQVRQHDEPIRTEGTAQSASTQEAGKTQAPTTIGSAPALVISVDTADRVVKPKSDVDAIATVSLEGLVERPSDQRSATQAAPVPPLDLTATNDEKSRAEKPQHPSGSSSGQVPSKGATRQTAAPDKDAVTGVNLWKDGVLATEDAAAEDLGLLVHDEDEQPGGITMKDLHTRLDQDRRGPKATKRGTRKRPHRSAATVDGDVADDESVNDSDYDVPDLVVEDDLLEQKDYSIRHDIDSLETLLKNSDDRHQAFTQQQEKSVSTTDPEAPGQVSPSLTAQSPTPGSPNQTQRAKLRLRPSASTFSNYSSKPGKLAVVSLAGIGPISVRRLAGYGLPRDHDRRLPSVHETEFDEVRTITEKLDEIVNDQLGPPPPLELGRSDSLGSPRSRTEDSGSPSTPKHVKRPNFVQLAAGTAGGGDLGGGDTPQDDLPLTTSDSTPRLRLTGPYVDRVARDSEGPLDPESNPFAKRVALAQAQVGAERAKYDTVVRLVKEKLYNLLRARMAKEPKAGLHPLLSALAAIRSDRAVSQMYFNSPPLEFEDDFESHHAQPTVPKPSAEAPVNVESDQLWLILNHGTVGASLDAHINILCQQLSNLDPDQLKQMDAEALGLDEQLIEDLFNLVDSQLKRDAMLTLDSTYVLELDQNAYVDDRAIVKDTLISRSDNRELLQELERSTEFLRKASDQSARSLSARRERLLAEVDAEAFAHSELNIEMVSPRSDPVVAKGVRSSSSPTRKGPEMDAQGKAALRLQLADADAASVINLRNLDADILLDTDIDNVMQLGTAIFTPASGAAAIRVGPPPSEHESESDTKDKVEYQPSAVDSLVRSFDASGTDFLLKRLARRNLLKHATEAADNRSEFLASAQALEQSTKTLDSKARQQFTERMKALLKKIHTADLQPIAM